MTPQWTRVGLTKVELESLARWRLGMIGTWLVVVIVTAGVGLLHEPSPQVRRDAMSSAKHR